MNLNNWNDPALNQTEYYYNPTNPITNITADVDKCPYKTPCGKKPCEIDGKCPAIK
jgi:hypothetical protein